LSNGSYRGLNTRLGQWIGYNWVDTIKTASGYYLLRFFLDRGSFIKNLDGNREELHHF